MGLCNLYCHITVHYHIDAKNTGSLEFIFLFTESVFHRAEQIVVVREEKTRHFSRTSLTQVCILQITVKYVLNVLAFFTTGVCCFWRIVVRKSVLASTFRFFPLLFFSKVQNRTWHNLSSKKWHQMIKLFFSSLKFDWGGYRKMLNVGETCISQACCTLTWLSFW